MLGSHVVFHVPEEHHTTTTKTPHGGEAVELAGSVHHPELTDFAGLVTRVHPAVTAVGATKTAPAVAAKPATYDIVIFPPGRAPVHVENVRVGKDDGQIELVNT
jgi:hypothetical protein